MIVSDGDFSNDESSDEVARSRWPSATNLKQSLGPLGSGEESSSDDENEHSHEDPEAGSMRPPSPTPSTLSVVSQAPSQVPSLRDRFTIRQFPQEGAQVTTEYPRGEQSALVANAEEALPYFPTDSPPELRLDRFDSYVRHAYGLTVLMQLWFVLSQAFFPRAREQLLNELPSFWRIALPSLWMMLAPLGSMLLSRIGGAVWQRLYPAQTSAAAYSTDEEALRKILTPQLPILNELPVLYTRRQALIYFVIAYCASVSLAVQDDLNGSNGYLRFVDGLYQNSDHFGLSLLFVLMGQPVLSQIIDRSLSLGCRSVIMAAEVAKVFYPEESAWRDGRKFVARKQDQEQREPLMQFYSRG